MKNDSSHKVQRRVTVMLILSLGLNLALVFAAVKFMQKTSAAPALPPTKASTMKLASPPSAAEVPAGVTRSANEIRWSKIVSTNYEQYVANLRGIGCPEKTVRAIVVPDIKRHYNESSRRTEMNLPFWTGGKIRQAAMAAQRSRDAALDQEQANLIQRLFGIEYPDDDFFTHGMEEQAIWRFITGPMPDQTFMRMIGLVGKYKILKKQFDERTDDLPTAAEKAEAKALFAAGLRELQAVLPPAEYDEMKARIGAVQMLAERFFGNDKLFEASGLTAYEARQVSAAWGGNLASDFLDFKQYETDEEQELHKVQFTNAAVQMVGQKRFSEFLRAQDRDFVRLYELARENQLPRESAVQIYEMRHLAAQEVERIRRDESLDDAARNRSYAGMQAELQRTVSGVLGTAAYEDYLNRGGNWLTNLSKL